MDKTICPKCKCPHLESFLKPTLCALCQEKNKQFAIQKKAEEEALQLSKRSASYNYLNNLTSKKLESGDVLVRNSNGWLFYPKGDNFNHLMTLVDNIGILCDWGGVGSLFLESSNKDTYIQNPPKIYNSTDKNAWIYSYTPIGKVKELEKMWNSANASGFDGMIITTQKGVNENGNDIPNEVGKHQLLMLLSDSWECYKPDYYEDTASILDHLFGTNINLFWVKPKDTIFREMIPVKIPETNWLEQEEFLDRILA